MHLAQPVAQWNALSGAGRDKTRAAGTGAPMAGGEWSEAELNATMGRRPEYDPVAMKHKARHATPGRCERPEHGRPERSGGAGRPPGATLGRGGGSSLLKQDSRLMPAPALRVRQRAQT